MSHSPLYAESFDYALSDAIRGRFGGAGVLRGGAIPQTGAVDFTNKENYLPVEDAPTLRLPVPPLPTVPYIAKYSQIRYDNALSRYERD